MMRLDGTRLLTLGAAALAIALAACGGDKRDCAAGTIPDPSGANQCVPDGSVICGNGTTYDMTSGKCVAGGQCAAGEVLVNGTCTTDVHVDAEEAAEPNDAASAGTITVPAAGAPGFVAHGCITPRDTNTTADLDPWSVTVTGPTLLEVTAAGVGGLAAGFEVAPNDPNLQTLSDNGWQRFGINLTGTTSSRQIFLPAAGTYDLILADSRQLFLQESVAGTDQTCYFTTVKQLALPTPTALTGATKDGTIGGEVQFFTVTPGEGDLVDVANDMPSGAANGSVVLVNNSAYQRSAEESTDPFSGSPVPAEALVGGLKASDQVVIAVDTTYNYAIAPSAFTLTLTQIHAAALPTNGQVTTTEDAQFYTFLYFDVAHDGDVLNFDLTFADDSALLISDANLGRIATVADVANGDSPIGSYQGWVRFAKAGRYYVQEFHPSLSAGNTTVTTSKLTAVSPAALTLGAASNASVNGAANSAWFTLDPANNGWLKLVASGTAFGGQLKMTFYPSDGVGAFDAEIAASFGAYTFNPNGSTNHGLIAPGSTATYIVRVEDTGTPGNTTAASVTASMQTYTDLGTVTTTTGVDKTGEDLGGAGNRKLYLVHATAGNLVSVTVHPAAVTFVPTLTELDSQENTAQTGGVSGTDRTFTTAAGASGWVAFAVTGTGTTSAYDVHVTASVPTPYTVTSGALTFTDACTGTGSSTLTMTATGSDPANDEGLSAAQTMPFAFKLYGASASTFVVSTNGWLSFGSPTSAGLSNGHIPVAGEPDGFFAPYWDDLDTVVVCKKVAATTVTVQWTGVRWGTTEKVQTQVVMHSNGNVDFIYSATHAGTGASATVGAEDLTGTLGNEISYNTASVTASSSKTLTP